jgi:hypothetical protein
MARYYRSKCRNKDVIFIYPPYEILGGWSTPSPGRLYPGYDPLPTPVPIVYEGRWTLKTVLDGYEKFQTSAIWFRSPDRPAQIECGHAVHNIIVTNLILEIFIAKALFLKHELLNNQFVFL